MAWKLTGKHLDERTGEQVFDPFPGVAWVDWEDDDAFRAAVRDYARRQGPDGLSDRTLFANGFFGFFEHVDEKPSEPSSSKVTESGGATSHTQ